MAEYLEAFVILSDQRRVSGYGILQKINIKEIESYVNMVGASDPETLIRFIRVMDNAYLKMIYERREREKVKGNDNRS